ncbi:MAG: FAD binding domain-containing protein [Acidobacteriota bacterium]|nr:FAD binding domain-containing protein [Acidobacteriota bacterium]
MSLPSFRLLRPKTLDGAIAMMAEYAGDLKVVAGGTDLLPSMKQKLFTPGYVLDLRGIIELRGIRSVSGKGIEIGALTALTTIEHDPTIRRDYPVLYEATKTVASPVLRNMGTIGGNLCLDTRCLWYNQSLVWRQSCGFCLKKDGELCHVAPGGKYCWATFSGDTPPALLCLGAEIEIAGPGGVRCTPLSEFYVNDGIVRLHLAANEIVTRVFLPESSAGWRGSYQKLRVRGSIDYPLAGVAVALKLRSGRVEDARVAITAVNPAPFLVKDVDAQLVGAMPSEDIAERIGDLAASTAKPLTTSALTPEYRREMVRVFTKRAILRAAAN